MSAVLLLLLLVSPTLPNQGFTHLYYGYTQEELDIYIDKWVSKDCQGSKCLHFEIYFDFEYLDCNGLKYQSKKKYLKLKVRRLEIHIAGG